MKRIFLTLPLIITALACGSANESNQPAALHSSSATGVAPSSNPQFAETPVADSSSPISGTVTPIIGRRAVSENESLQNESPSSEMEIRSKYEPLETKPQATNSPNQTPGQSQGTGQGQQNQNGNRPPTR